MITPDGKITANFSLREMIHSETAAKQGIQNVPNLKHTDNLTALCENVLQPLRDKLGVSIKVSSGFRCDELNKLVGGAPTSQHRFGEAADISAAGMTTQDLFDFILASGIEYDQVIQEFGQWVHISYRRTGKNRNVALIATWRKNGTVKYTRLNNKQK